MVPAWRLGGPESFGSEVLGLRAQTLGFRPGVLEVP